MVCKIFTPSTMFLISISKDMHAAPADKIFLNKMMRSKWQIIIFPKSDYPLIKNSHHHNKHEDF